MDYKFAGNFAAAPLGPFTEANKRLVWPGLTHDADKGGQHFEIVADDRFPGGRACRLFYPKGQYGMQDQFYQIRLKSPQVTCNVEWYWLFEPGFSFFTEVEGGDGGGGKLGPCAQWGEVGGEDSKRGTRAMIWWNSRGSHITSPCLNPILQDQRTGNQLVQPTKYTQPIVLDQVYRFRIQLKGGPDGFSKHWVIYPGATTETLLAEVKGKNLMATATDDTLIDFAFFSGGASLAYSPAHDSYARHGGIRYWSGETYWAEDSGNGDGGGTGEGGGGTEPVPPTGSPSTVEAVITVGADTYSGTLTKD